ncbi:hypothetical protein EDD21DRAFT_363861 [Dissophora ornata]|nr:hypothetical protein BGZ58_003252 [Dissophora ornata]KAI8605364.1 hypothetical protein EDD21DRAFT_363861 [Dissophora ornata]
MDFLLDILKAYPSAKYGALLLAYMALIRHLRFKRINALLKKYPDPTLPLRDYQVAKEVAGVVNDFEFPFLVEVSLEFALFKTYAIPSISRILAATKQFTASCLKRADDTSLILFEMNEGHSRNLRRTMTEGKVDENEVLNDEKRAKVALERLNFIHGHYNIKQDDYLYTLSLFVLEPPRFLDSFEWRKLTELEKNALLANWTVHGEGMGIQNIPKTREELEAWSDEYERQYSAFATSNVAIAESTTDLLLSLAPSFMHPFGRQAVSALLTPRLREAFGIAPPAKIVSILVHSTLWLRATFIKYLMPPRRLPLVRTALRTNSENKYVPNYNKYQPVYPDGYRVEDLGPNKFLGKCPVSFHPSGITPASTSSEASTKTKPV